MTYLTMKGFNKTPPPIWLCFTAEAYTAIMLNKVGAPTSVTIEYSTDKTNWSTYTFGTYIYLNNAGDKVYFRNTSETDTGFSTNNSNYYYFIINGGNATASGDVTTLLNKNGTNTLSNYCFTNLFVGCRGLITAPKLPATNLASYCYYSMFNNCTNLETLPKLPALTLKDRCYSYMFYNCSKIKLSSSKTGEYQTEYRIPTTGTGTSGSASFNNMFNSTGGTYTSNPSINTTYYTSNTLV